jgi:aryl-alcohol dehydrogenase-like predicted oxidoreductase
MKLPGRWLPRSGTADLPRRRGGGLVSSTQPLARSGWPRLGLGTMTWGDPSGLGRFTPAKLAYGGAEGAAEEALAFESSLAAGVTLFDTAAMYSNGACEQRLGVLARGTAAMIATKFLQGMRATTEDMPRALEGSLARLGRDTVDLYQHHFPAKRVDIPLLMRLMADAVAAGSVRAGGDRISSGSQCASFRRSAVTAPTMSRSTFTRPASPSLVRRARPMAGGPAGPTSVAARRCLSLRRAPRRRPWPGSCPTRGGPARRRRTAAGSCHRCW